MGTSIRDSLYLSEDPTETTFKYDDKLPNLPVPELEQSIRKLLESIKPIAPNEEAYRVTEQRAIELLRDPGVAELQRHLKERSQQSKNWLEAWWLEFAYLRSRKPLIPYSNMAAPIPIMPERPIIPKNHPDYQYVRANRAAESIYNLLQFWKILRDERMRPMLHKGVPWSMNQFKFLYNTVRVPNEPADQLITNFRTAREGLPISTDVIILFRGHIIALDVVEVDQRENRVTIMPLSRIASLLRKIEDTYGSRRDGPGLASLTTLERGEWAEARSKIINLSTKNKDNLDMVEKALFVVSLDDAEPTTTDQILRLSMCGDPRNRWADKSVSSIAFRNGLFGATADHTPYDGFCTGIMIHFLMTSIKENYKDENEESSWSRMKHSKLYIPKYLDFDLNPEIKLLIEEACDKLVKITGTIETSHQKFDHFGKALLKEHRFHPEAFVQCAIHAAYFKQHGEMAPTYVTASTRRFHNGRTETCRSCYPEMKEFVEHLANEGPSNPSKGYDLLRRSVNRFQTIMAEAVNGQGCDRHLMGLYLQAMMEGKDIPELFDDELVQKTNNYILSTSCSGYWDVCGGVPPYVEDGYGCFYGIEDNAITVACSAYTTSKVTDARRFYANIKQSLIEMQKILLNAKL